jgi:hypothetical protein
MLQSRLLLLCRLQWLGFGVWKGGVGFYRSFDSRYSKSVAAKTGGLSQATTYIAGCESLFPRTRETVLIADTVSGGCIAIMVLASNDFVDIQTLVTGGAFNNLGK